VFFVKSLLVLRLIKYYGGQPICKTWLPIGQLIKTFFEHCIYILSLIVFHMNRTANALFWIPLSVSIFNCRISAASALRQFPYGNRTHGKAPLGCIVFSRRLYTIVYMDNITIVNTVNIT
jgi:hypothetical protein